MTDQRTEGQWDETKGKVKEGVGDVTGNERLEREGEGDQAQGKIKQGIADVQEKLQDAGDKISEEVDRRR